jgi:gliding motility-associated-like protein
MVFDAWADFDTIYEGQQIGLHATNFGTNYTYQWTPSTALSDASIYNPLADPTKSTTYTVEVNDAYGCHWSDVISIYVIDVICEEPYIYVPNAFTPDGDGKNDLIYVNSSVGYELQWMIFDRWGELVFETSDINQAWDGTYKGEKLNAGVYVYHLKLTCYSKEVFIKKGNITLIR